MPSRVRKSLSVLVVVAALGLGACTDSGELGGPSVGGTLAARIGDVQYTNADLEDEVELWASNPEFLLGIGVGQAGAPGRRSASLVAFVLSHRVLSEQARLMSAEAGLEPTQADIDAVIAQVDQGFAAPGGGSVFAAYPEDFRQQLGRDLSYQNNLQMLLSSGAAAPSAEVSSRYGSIEEIEAGLFQVRPPQGPAPSPLALADLAGQ